MLRRRLGLKSESHVERISSPVVGDISKSESESDVKGSDGTGDSLVVDDSSDDDTAGTRQQQQSRSYLQVDFSFDSLIDTRRFSFDSCFSFDSSIDARYLDRSSCSRMSTVTTGGLRGATNKTTTSQDCPFKQSKCTK